MSDPLEPVQPGDPPPLRADTWNLVLDSAREFRNRRQGRAGGGEIEPDPVTGNVLVWVRNDSGSTRAAFSVLELGQPLTDVTDVTGNPHAFRQKPVFPGTAPSGPDIAFAVTIDPLASGAVGRAVLLGACVCDVDVSVITHTHAAPAAGTTAALASAVSGPARIVWRVAGTGTQRALVVLNGQDRQGFFAVLATSSGGLWKWTPESGGGSTSATFNARPLTTDGTNLLNPVTGLRVWMVPSSSTPGTYEFLPVGYADSNVGGTIKNAVQHIPAEKIFDDHVTVNYTRTPAGAQSGTGEVVSFESRCAQLAGDPVGALQSVDTYVSNALSRRALYAFREVWNSTYSTTYQGVRVGGYLAAVGENVGSSAFVAVRTALSGGLMCRSYESSGTESAGTDAVVSGWGYVWWNPMPMEVYTAASGIGYAFLGQLRAVGRPNGNAATFDKTAELNLFVLNKPTAAGTPNTIAGQYLFLENRDSGVPMRYAAPDGFAVADLDVNGRITDGVSGTTATGDTVQGGIITALGSFPSLPAPPGVDGTYTLTLTVSGGGTSKTLAWV